MSMREGQRLRRLRDVGAGGALIAAAMLAAAQTAPHLGRPITPLEAARDERNVFPDGRGLPPGRGTGIEGAALFAQKCAVCHGEGGRGGAAEELVGGTAPLTAKSPDKTIGAYWPYATTLFDFTRRAMPMNAPGSLQPDEIYALTAYLLAAEKVIGERDEMNAVSA